MPERPLHTDHLDGCSEAERAALHALGARIGHELVAIRLQREGRRVPAPRLSHRLIRAGLTLGGLRARGRRNVLDIQLRHNEVWLQGLPPAFDGFTLLQLSDPHLDMDEQFLQRLVERVRGLAFDACVLTGDFRFHGHGPFAAALDGLRSLRAHLGEQPFAVLGNHDTIRMVPGMEALGYRVLMNESTTLQRGAQVIVLAGIDDAHRYRTHDLGQALAGVAPERTVVLLSHTPQPYRQAADAGVHFMLSGHTHGGQVCLPGGIPILTDTPAPRAVVRGAWQHGVMAGYTSVGCGSSVVDVRLNCRPEVVLHRLRRRVGMGSGLAFCPQLLGGKRQDLTP